jgi:hypothetical protein
MSRKSLRKKEIFFIAVLAINLAVVAQPISKYLVGNNAWQYPGDDVWNVVSQVGYQVIRFGGEGYDKGDVGGFGGWAGKTFGMGAMPIIQVPQNASAGSAAGMVDQFKDVVLWNIGNEPDLGIFGGSPNMFPEISAYVKDKGSAMKKARKSIKIYAPDCCELSPLVYDNLIAKGGQYDVCGKDANGNYYIDGISWHRYPFEGGKEKNGVLTSWFTDDMRENIKLCKKYVDDANKRVGRTGADKLGWGNGEYNANPADGPSFENGLMHVMVLGYAMKNEATYMCSWSMKEGYNFSAVLGGGLAPYAKSESLIAKNFSGWFFDAMDEKVGCESKDNIYAYACKDTDKVAAMIVNRSINGSKEYSFTLRFDDKKITTGDVQLNFNAATEGEYSDKIPANSMMLLRFNSKTGTKYVYSNGMGDPAKSTIATSPFTVIVPYDPSSAVQQPIGLNESAKKSIFSTMTQIGRNLSITFPASRAYTIQIVNLNGKKMATYSGTGSLAKISTGALAMGHYCMQVTTSDGALMKRIVLM